MLKEKKRNRYNSLYIFYKFVYHHLERLHHLCLCLQNGELKLADFGLARAFGIPVRCYSAEVCFFSHQAAVHTKPGAATKTQRFPFFFTD